MKGNPAVLEELNKELVDELTAVSQYMVHSSMCANWGFAQLHEVIEKRAVDEMKHAERLIERILFLEGVPVVSTLNKMEIGKDVKAQFEFDRKSEAGAISAYNHSIKVADDAGDNGSVDLFTSILLDEEAHISWLQKQLYQVEQMGIQVYLAEKG